MIALSEKPNRTAIRIPNDYLVGDLEEVSGSPPNVALTGATIVEVATKAVNMIFAKGVGRDRDVRGRVGCEPLGHRVRLHAATGAPVGEHLPAGRPTADATTILDARLIDFCWYLMVEALVVMVVASSPSYQLASVRSALCERPRGLGIK